MKKIIPVVLTSKPEDLQKALEAEIQLRYNQGEECWGMTLAFQPDGRATVVCMFEKPREARIENIGKCTLTLDGDLVE